MQPYFLHFGILSLSDDILALIFENLLLERDGYARVTPEHCISHVCRRFRSVSLGLPKLWSHVTNNMSRKWVAINLLRSKSAGLAVSIHSNTWRRSIARFAQQVIPHARRWQSFRLMTLELRTTYRTFSQKLEKQFASLTLPALTFFEMSLEALTDPDMDFDNTNFDDFEFYKSWDMPKLRHVNMTHHIPPNAIRGSKTVTSFTFTNHWTSGELDIQKLMDFLSSLDNLTELSLELTGYANNDAGLADRIVLPKVESFELTTVFPEALEVMMTSVWMPALTKLSIDVSEDDQLPMRKWLDLISTKGCPSVKDFTFIHQDYTHCAFDLCTIFEKFPNMQNLSLDTPNSFASTAVYSLPLPPFRSLSLTHKSGINLLLMDGLTDYFSYNIKNLSIQYFYF
ncbi:hypothetical protein DFH11DRAFT_552440 [Phellopilus nigrolimitatus]|nr:hypothetical protein DFH11DRAFT_552440 [Phellopilus nigrolimitatus]